MSLHAFPSPLDRLIFSIKACWQSLEILLLISGEWDRISALHNTSQQQSWCRQPQSFRKLVAPFKFAWDEPGWSLTSNRSISSLTISRSFGFFKLFLLATKIPSLSNIRPPSISFRLFSLRVTPVLTYREACLSSKPYSFHNDIFCIRMAAITIVGSLKLDASVSGLCDCWVSQEAIALAPKAKLGQLNVISMSTARQHVPRTSGILLMQDGMQSHGSLTSPNQGWYRLCP